MCCPLFIRIMCISTEILICFIANMKVISTGQQSIPKKKVPGAPAPRESAGSRDRRPSDKVAAQCESFYYMHKPVYKIFPF